MTSDTENGTQAPNIPSAVNSRIDSIDATRGVALFLILFSHCVQSFFATSRYVGTSEMDAWCMNFFQLFCLHKSMMLFALLFGMSFYFQMRKEGAATSVCFAKCFAFRLGYLAVFGYINCIFDKYDMLLPFALCGIVLIMLWRLRTHWLAFAALFLLCHPLALGEYALNLQDPLRTFLLSHAPAAPDTQISSWVDLCSWNLVMHIPFILSDQYCSHRLFDVAGMFLLGCCIGRLRIMEPQNSSRLARACLLSALLLALAYTIRHYVHVPGRLFHILQSYLDVLQTLFYALFFSLVFRMSTLAWLCRPMAAIGKSTLSCYMSQGVILSFLMYGWGLGWAETMPASQKAILAIAVFILQMLFCVLWLKKRHQCPMEMLWRHAVSRSSPQIKRHY